ncbi:MAG TPA: 2-oxoacid:acceptor oxidoreductase family protein [Elusimicrobiales bacterium]|nr:2-oxoacid:acceptor oxidoreductase family protein [Elusimicrobiales bacterium]
MAYNIYLCGVGGQGIGLLATVLAQAAYRSGLDVAACDTHGLAQRGGVVASHIRLGADALTPLVPEGGADLVLALERLEALRGAALYLKPGGRVIYYDTAYQPVSVRRGQASYPGADEIEKELAYLRGIVVRVAVEGIADPRMQNAALLGRLAALNVVPGLGAGMIEEVLKEMVAPVALEENLKIFRSAR